MLKRLERRAGGAEAPRAAEVSARPWIGLVVERRRARLAFRAPGLASAVHRKLHQEVR